jgi:hypothetical protein
MSCAGWEFRAYFGGDLGYCVTIAQFVTRKTTAVVVGPNRMCILGLGRQVAWFWVTRFPVAGRLDAGRGSPVPGRPIIWSPGRTFPVARLSGRRVAGFRSPDLPVPRSRVAGSWMPAAWLPVPGRLLAGHRFAVAGSRSPGRPTAWLPVPHYTQ